MKFFKKNKILVLGLAAIILATVLIYAYVEYSGTKINIIPTGEEKCGIENCHGLDITCGPNIPDVCTEIYMIGDGCREYARCEIINGKCQLVQNKKFEDCKSCVEKCSEDFKNAPIKLSQCAYKCAEAGELTCKNLCGDGICQEIVCMAIGCPCAETAETCPEDCKAGEEQTCNEKCKSLGYKSGICRTWPIVPNAERGCKENEKDIGKTSDCTLVRTIGEIDRVIVGVGKTCCCQDKISEDCAKEGESVPVVPGALECCEGLTKISCVKPDANNICPGICVGASICAKCGNGICGLGENRCNCPEDCSGTEKCIGEGEVLRDTQGTKGQCCESLHEISSGYWDGIYYCTSEVCGNGECKAKENKYNCPEDCKEDSGKCYSDKDCESGGCPQVIGGDKPMCDLKTNQCYCGGVCGDGYCDPIEKKYETCPKDCKSTECIKEGKQGNKFKSEKCCTGLTSISLTFPTSDGGCSTILPGGGFICAKCGNGICGLGENRCNCPEDCKEDEKYNLDEYYSNIDYSCNTDSDCVIKDIYNCCGYYPKCVNENAKVDPDYVRKACTAEGISSVCGFPSIDSCKCVQNKCEGFLKDGEKLSADLNGDGKVNLTDAAILMSFWEKDPSGAVSCQSPDINQDGAVNLTDSAIMMSQWTTLF